VKWLTHHDQYVLAFSIIVDDSGIVLSIALTGAVARIIFEQVGLHRERADASSTCPLLTLSGHAARASEGPLLGVKRT
jgi:hypothetical protein